MFCVIDCDLAPRIATERLDSSETRLDKIVELIRGSRYSIHDLSRAQAKAAGEPARLNMPFELGIDYGISIVNDNPASAKRLLVIAEQKYLYQAALSDIAGWDIIPHGGDFEEAIRAVRSWLASRGLASRSGSQIIGDYVGYQEWDYERLLDSGWSDKDIRHRGTSELLEAMGAWRDTGRPMTFS